MDMSAEAIREFQALYRAHFDVDLSAQEAEAEAQKLISFVRLLHRLDN